MKQKYVINYSPNFSSYRRINKEIKFIIIHYTGMKKEHKAIERLIDINSKVSCHYFIRKNGEIILMVPENYVAWHAGKSNWGKYSSLNNFSIGVELQNSGHQYGYKNFETKQINSLIKLCKKISKKFKIKKQNILGHSDISFDRKQDPGEKFPWKLLAKNNIGIWHNFNEKKLKKFRRIKIDKKDEKVFFKNLNKIGYLTLNLDTLKRRKLVAAFQRRYRPKLINSIIDLECAEIAKKISKY
tara:strand:+ start:1519 stop:2244 length:726 start_codon:yes stop_codon:yes gene_type:complete